MDKRHGNKQARYCLEHQVKRAGGGIRKSKKKKSSCKPLTSQLLQAALYYASCGWYVFPLHTVFNGACSCGDRNCKDPGKHPRTEHGFKDATINEEEISRFWDQWPDANIGIATGRKSKLVVLDEDPRHGGAESRASLEGKFGPIPDTRRALTGGADHGRHYYLRHPGGSVEIKNAQSLAGYQGIDVRGDGGYVVAPPSLHSSGNRYHWDESSPLDLAPIPRALLKLIRKNNSGKTSSISLVDTIPEGTRNSTIASIAGYMRYHGMTEEEMLPSILAVNSLRCSPPLDEKEVKKIVRSVSNYPPAHNLGKESATPMNAQHRILTLDQLEARFDKQLLLADRDVVKVVIANVVANRLDGDPLWLFLIGPPSGVKTELLRSVNGIPLVYPLSDLTTHTFASGMKGPDASLLSKLDHGTILVLKDFTTVLSMNRDMRGEILEVMGNGQEHEVGRQNWPHRGSHVDPRHTLCSL
jgi:hypothetical protein